MRDLLARPRRHRTPPIAGPPPNREPHLAHHPVAHLRIADRRPRVSRRLPRHLHLRIQLRRNLRRLHRHLELRPLVFLHIHIRAARRLPLHANHHPPRQPIPRRRETPAERPIIIRRVLRLRDLLPVRIGKNHRQRLPADHLVIVLVPIRPDANPLVLHRLPRTIQRAVREKNRLRLHIRRPLVTPVVKLIRRRQLLILVTHKNQLTPLRIRRPRKQPVRIRLQLRPLRKLVVVPPHPELHIRPLDRIPRPRIQHEPLDLRVPIPHPHHHRQITHPHIRERHHVAGLPKPLLMTRDQKIKPRLQILRRRNLLRALLEIIRRRQLHRPLQIRLRPQQRRPLIRLQPLRTVIPRLQPRDPILLHHPEMHLRHIPVTHINYRQRRVPNPLRAHMRRLRLNLPHQVVTQLPPDAVRKSLLPLLRNLVRLHQIILPVQHPRPLIPRPSRNLMIRPLIHKPLQRRLVAPILLLPKRLVVPKPQPRQIAMQQRRLLRILRVKNQQRLIKPHRLQRDRILVRRRRLPLQKLPRRRKDRTLRRQLERILRLRRRLLPRRIKNQRLMRHKIKQRRPVTVRHRALLQQIVKRPDRDLLQLPLRRKRLHKLPVDLRKQPRQIPRRDILPRRLRRRRPVQKAVPVVLEIMPVPVRQNRIHHRHHLLRSLRNLRLHPRNLLLHLAPLDHPLKRNPPRNRLDRLRPRLLPHRPIDDRPQLLNRRLRQPLARRILHLLPKPIPLPRRRERAGKQQQSQHRRQRVSCIHRVWELRFEVPVPARKSKPSAPAPPPAGKAQRPAGAIAAKGSDNVRNPYRTLRTRLSGPRAADVKDM